MDLANHTFDAMLRPAIVRQAALLGVILPHGADQVLFTSIVASKVMAIAVGYAAAQAKPGCADIVLGSVRAALIGDLDEMIAKARAFEFTGKTNAHAR